MECRVTELTQQLRITEARNTALERRLTDLETQVAMFRAQLSAVFGTASRELSSNGMHAVQADIIGGVDAKRVNGNVGMGKAGEDGEMDEDTVSLLPSEDARRMPLSGRTLRGGSRSASMRRGSRSASMRRDYGDYEGGYDEERDAGQPRGWYDGFRYDRRVESRNGDYNNSDNRRVESRNDDYYSNNRRQFGGYQRDARRDAPRDEGYVPPHLDKSGWDAGRAANTRSYGAQKHPRQPSRDNAHVPNEKRRRGSPHSSSPQRRRVRNDAKSAGERSVSPELKGVPSNRAKGTPNNNRDGVGGRAQESDKGWGAYKPEWIEPVTNASAGWNVDAGGGQEWGADDKGGKDKAGGKWPVVEPASAAGDPVMPASVRQMSGAVLPSAGDKVRAWQQDAASPARIEAELLNEAEPAAGIMDSDTDSDDPLTQLQSRGMRTQLRDTEGAELTAARLAPTWGVCGWLREDDVARRYRLALGVPLWDAPTGRVRAALRRLPVLSEWQQAGAGVLLFRHGGHLKAARNSQRVFVQDCSDALLFFFVATTVLQPLRRDQASVVERLWTATFVASPVKVKTVRAPRQRAEARWPSMDALWGAALDWLLAVARSAAEYGRKYMADKIDAWGGQGEWPAGDADAGLVFGLTRDELLGLLAVAPELLAELMPPHDLLQLEDELAQPI